MNRRELLNRAAGMVWVAPVVLSIEIPAHAQASECLTDCDPDPCEDIRYRGENPIELPNSGDATELDFVRGFCPACVSAGRVEPGGTAWQADDHYAVVLIKAGRPTFVWTNVQRGDVLRTEKDISHVSCFPCVAT
jgi:hypothetical protein